MYTTRLRFPYSFLYCNFRSVSFTFEIVLLHCINSLTVALLRLEAKLLTWKLISGRVWLYSRKSWLVLDCKTSFSDVTEKGFGYFSDRFVSIFFMFYIYSQIFKTFCLHFTNSKVFLKFWYKWFCKTAIKNQCDLPLNWLLLS